MELDFQSELAPLHKILLLISSKTFKPNRKTISIPERNRKTITYLEWLETIVFGLHSIHSIYGYRVYIVYLFYSASVCTTTVHACSLNSQSFSHTMWMNECNCFMFYNQRRIHNNICQIFVHIWDFWALTTWH